MKVFLIFFLALNLFGFDDASYNRGETLYFKKGCNSCHGAEAEGSTIYPKLANKKTDFLEKRFKFFKYGKLQTVNEQMMSQFIKPLSDKEIKDLIYFISNHKETKTEDVPDDLLGGFGS